MVAYRIYCMDGTGRIQFAEPLLADDDEDAVAKAREQKIHSVKCEVWHLDRLVATLNAQDLAD